MFLESAQREWSLLDYIQASGGRRVFESEYEVNREGLRAGWRWKEETEMMKMNGGGATQGHSHASEPHLSHLVAASISGGRGSDRGGVRLSSVCHQQQQVGAGAACVHSPPNYLSSR